MKRGIVAMAWLAVASLIGLIETARASEPPGRALVCVTVEPGKPGATRETVELKRQADGCELRVRRIDTHGRAIADRRAAVGARDFEAVWRIVTAGGLDRFEPAPVDDPEPDFGEVRLRIETEGPGADGPKVHERAWERSLENGDRVRPLIEALAGLARRAAPEIELFYIR